VSPDGREVLVAHGSDLYAVDLQSGERRSILSGFYYYDSLGWSPRGR
jgi:Tol biopolymer transport system component